MSIRDTGDSLVVRNLTLVCAVKRFCRSHLGVVDHTQWCQFVVWHPLGLDLPGGGLHVILVLVVQPLPAGLVRGTWPLVKLAGGDCHGQCSYGVGLEVHGLCPALLVRLDIFLELTEPNPMLVRFWEIQRKFTSCTWLNEVWF